MFALPALVLLALALPAWARPALDPGAPREGVATRSTTCSAWEEWPVASGLHPVRWNYAERFWHHTETTMSGPRASPIFNRTVGQADAHWRLLAATGRGLDLSTAATENWHEMAGAGAFLGIGRVVEETAARSEELDALRTAVDTLLSPRLDLTFRRDGRVEAGHPTGWALGERLRRLEEEEGFGDASPPGRRSGRRSPAPRVSAGVGWRLRDLDADPAEPLLTWSASLAVRNVGLSLWRADVSLLDGHWSTLARRQIVDGVSASVRVASEPTGPTPARWGAGLVWAPEPRWAVRLERSAPLAGEGWSVDLALRVEVGARLPSTLAQPLAPWPTTPEGGPNRLTSLNHSPAREFSAAGPATSGCAGPL